MICQLVESGSRVRVCELRKAVQILSKVVRIFGKVVEYSFFRPLTPNGASELVKTMWVVSEISPYDLCAKE